MSAPHDPTPTPGAGEHEARVAAIRARLAAATRGDWVAAHTFAGFWYVYERADDAILCRFTQGEDEARGNADFVAHAPADLALLLAALAALTPEVVAAATDAMNVEAARAELFAKDCDCLTCDLGGRCDTAQRHAQHAERLRTGLSALAALAGRRPATGATEDGA